LFTECASDPNPFAFYLGDILKGQIVQW